jgi:hypothetical protein
MAEDSRRPDRARAASIINNIEKIRRGHVDERQGHPIRPSSIMHNLLIDRETAAKSIW